MAFQPLPSVDGEETVSEVLKFYEKKGYEGSFSVRPDGMVRCHTCREEEPSDQAPLRALHRFEGTSDPDDEAVVAALECPACGVWGTLTLAYGPEASADDMRVLQHLMDDRDQSNIASGR